MIHRIFRTAAALFALVGCLAVFADGRVTQQNAADPITTWRIAELKFLLLDPSQKSAIVNVAYIRESGTVDHLVSHTITGEDYSPLLGALSASIGNAESGCATIENGAVVSVDRACVLNLRLSHWLVTHGKIEGVTAEPLQAD